MVIDVADLRMTYGTVEVLTGVSFQAHRGEVLALLGPNGAGKSTTIEILEGFRIRSAGAVSVLGADPVDGDEAWRARLGVVLQSWRDHARWRVAQLLSHLAAYYRPYSTPLRPRPMDVGELLDLVGLASQAGHKVGSLSGGQRRRLDVAIGLIGRPDLLFLDEPTTGFDPQARRDFHDLDEAEKLSDRILVLAGGRILADGSAAQLSRQVEGRTEVRWTRDGESFVHAADDGTAFVRELFAQYGDRIGDLEVRRASLEDSYMALVHRFEAGDREVSSGLEMLR